MARGDKPYYRVEVPFVEGPEFCTLSAEAWKLYSFLMARCVSTHRTTIYQLSYRYLASHTGLNYQRIPSALEELARCPYGKEGQPLVNYTPTTTQQRTNDTPMTHLFSINIEGMARNNARYQWSDSPHDPHTPPIGSPLIGPERTGEDINIPPTPQGGDVPEEPTSKPKPETTKKPTVDFHMDQFEIFREKYPIATDDRGRTSYRSNWTKAEEEWRKLMRKNFDPSLILQAEARYAADTNSQYVCAAERFLKNKLTDALRVSDPPTAHDSYVNSPAAPDPDRERIMEIVNGMRPKETT